MYLIFLITVGIIGTIFKGYVLTFLWKWFLVPSFNFPAISTVQAIGLSIIVSYLTMHISGKDRSKTSHTEDFLELIVYSFFVPLYLLFVGWVVKGYM